MRQPFAGQTESATGCAETAENLFEEIIAFAFSVIFAVNAYVLRNVTRQKANQCYTGNTSACALGGKPGAQASSRRLSCCRSRFEIPVISNPAVNFEGSCAS